MPDRTQLGPLNELWNIVDDRAPTQGARGRLAALARRLAARILSRQQTFNATVVDHLNRNMPVLDEMQLATERMEDMADALQREREAMLARDRRHDTTIAAIDEMRTAIGVLQQATQQLTRELRRLPADAGTAAPAASAAPSPTMTSAPQAFAALDSHKYVGFENAFRGSQDAITARFDHYLPLFDGAADVLDVGCGRGEFLEALAARGVRARGIDVNPSMVDVCVARGLDVTTAGALEYLRAQADGSLGGLFAAQVVEHLEPGYLVQLLDEAAAKLRPGSSIVLETINPACWAAFFESYIRDITHVRPLHPDTLKYLLVASGFQDVSIRYASPYPETGKLQAANPAADPSALAGAIETINANVEKLNALLFTWMDYAAVGRR
jgi:2-polyprenyl-3-methyl-5-hydroxy-6-metoxy-1,4-benzoquinol methylase